MVKTSFERSDGDNMRARDARTAAATADGQTGDIIEKNRNEFEFYST